MYVHYDIIIQGLVGKKGQLAIFKIPYTGLLTTTITVYINI